MNDDKELNDLMESIASKGMQVLSNLQSNPDDAAFYFKKYLTFLSDYQSLLATLSQNPEQVWKMQVDYWQEASTLLNNQFTSWLSGKAPPIEDKKFKGEEWVSNPMFNLLSQHYLLASKHVTSLMEHIEVKDKQTAHRVQFFARQLLEALSPANYLL